MKTFKQGNWENNTVCPLCNTSKEGEVVLIPINEKLKIAKAKGENIVEAKQIHVECISDKWIYSEQINAVVAMG